MVDTDAPSVVTAPTPSPTRDHLEDLASAVSDIADVLDASGLRGLSIRSVRLVHGGDRVVVELYLTGGEVAVDAAGDALGLTGEVDRPGFYVRAGSFRGVGVQVFSSPVPLRRLSAVTP